MNNGKHTFEDYMASIFVNVTAPRASNVWCCQCGAPFAIEPDRCACGGQGFTLRDPNARKVEG